MQKDVANQSDSPVFQLFCYAIFKITFHYLNLRNIYLLDFNILPTFAMNINYYIYNE